MDTVDSESGRYDARVVKVGLELCLLAMIEEGDRYGYELISALHNRDFPLGKQMGVYATLTRLEKTGLIESYKVVSGSGPPRRYYSITTEGSTFLRELTRQSFETLEVTRWIINEFSRIE